MNKKQKIIWLIKRAYRKSEKWISSYFLTYVKISQKDINYTEYVPAAAFSSAVDIAYQYHGEWPYWADFSNIKIKPLFTLKESTTVVGRGILINKSGEIILESTIGQLEYLKELGSNHLLFFRKLLRGNTIKKGIVLSNALEHNYYHWLLESIGRLAFLPEDTLNEYPIILNSRAQKFAIESLEALFGILPEKIILKNEYTSLRINETLIPSFPITRNLETEMTNIYHPVIIEKINTIVLGKVKKGGVQNFIISRGKAIERRILDEQLIQKEFPELKFKIVFLEELSFYEQMELFANANVIIATHGAGLTNLLFCRSALIIEFFPNTRYRRDAFYFYQISKVLKLHHHLIEYMPVNNQQDLKMNLNHIQEIKKCIST